MRLGDSKTVAFYNRIMKILTIISLLTTILNPFITNASGTFSNVVQASYSYGIGYFNVYENGSTTLNAQYYIDIDINIQGSYTGYIYINVTSPSSTMPSTYYPKYISVGGNYVGSGYTNAGITQFCFKITSSSHLYVRLYYGIGTLNTYYGLAQGVSQDLNWLNHGNDYVAVTSLTVSSFTKDSDLLTYIDDLESIISDIKSNTDNIETYVLNSWNQLITNGNTLNNISTNIYSIQTLLEYQKTILSQYDFNLHYFQFRINDSAVEGYPLITDTVTDLNNRYYFTELNNYSIRRLDFRTKQLLSDGNYIAYTFYFKTNVDNGIDWVSNMRYRFRDVNGYLADIPEYYIYIKNGRQNDDDSYYYLLTIYIPLYLVTPRLSTNQYNFSLSINYIPQEPFLTGVIKAGVIYRGTTDNLPNEDPANTDYTVLNKLDEIINILGNISIDNTDLTNKNTVDNFFNNLLENLNLPSFPDKDNEPMFPILQEFIGYYGQIIGNQHLSMYRWLLGISAVFLVLKVILL